MLNPLKILEMIRSKNDSFKSFGMMLENNRKYRAIKIKQKTKVIKHNKKY